MGSIVVDGSNGFWGVGVSCKVLVVKKRGWEARRGNSLLCFGTMFVYLFRSYLRLSVTGTPFITFFVAVQLYCAQTAGEG